MKKVVFVVCAFLVVAYGCDREPCAVCGDGASLRRISIDLSGGAPAVKSSRGTSDEERYVSSCALYVFSRAGELLQKYSSSDGRFDFYLTDETYDFVAIANKVGLPEKPRSRRELLATATSLAENGPGRFVMVGDLREHRIEGDEKITVEAVRLAAKLSCTIRTAFTGPLALRPFTVESVYLTNVAGSNDLALSAPVGNDPAGWHNRMDLDPGTAAPLSTLLACTPGSAMAPSDSLTPSQAFYAYPNESADSHDKSKWDSRCTRLVVRATLGGRTTYYPVTLPSVRRNRHYHVELEISNYGVDHPEDNPEDGCEMEATVTVDPWEPGGSLEGNY